MVRSARTVVAHAILVAALASGCASELALKAPSYRPRGARIVFMPAMVALYGLSSEGQMVSFGSDGPGTSLDAHLEFMDGKSKAARQTIDGWLKTFAEDHDSRIAELDEVAQTPMASNTFYNVMNTVTDAIVVDWLNNTWSPQPLSHWGHEARFDGWESALEADYVVFVKFVGSYETQALQDENGLKVFTGGPSVHARRIAILAVVDVRSGRIVCVRGVKFDGLGPGEIRSYMEKLAAPLEAPRPR
jgi:hypothetical protein